MNRSSLFSLFLACAAGATANTSLSVSPFLSFESLTTPLAVTTGWPANTVSLSPVGATDGLNALRINTVPTHPNGSWATVTFAQPTDLSQVGGLLMDAASTSTLDTSVVFFFTDGQNRQRRYDLLLKPGQTQSACLVIQDAATPPSTFGFMTYPNLVGNYRIVRPSPIAGATGQFDASTITKIEMCVLGRTNPSVLRSITLDNWRTTGPVVWSQYLTGWIDSFGQNARQTWPGKVTSVADLQAARVAENSDLAAWPGSSEMDADGGHAAGPTYAPHTYFRTIKDGGKWWIVTPGGKRFWMYGANSPATFDGGVVNGREGQFQWLPAAGTPEAAFYRNVTQSGQTVQRFAFAGLNSFRKYGDTTQVAYFARLGTRARSWGMNSYGAFGETRAYSRAYVRAITQMLSQAGTGRFRSFNVPQVALGTPMPDVYDPDFEADIETSMRWGANPTQIAVVGYYVGNCLPWVNPFTPEGRVGLPLAILGLDGAQFHSKNALVDFMLARYPNLAALNAAWGTNYASEAAFRAPAPFSGVPNAAMHADLRAFLVEGFADTYFSKINNAFRRVDPNHLYLGCRFSRADEEIWRVCAKYADAVSFNYYEDTLDTPDLSFLNTIDKPVIVSEFMTCSAERGVPVGVAWSEGPVDRAQRYQAFLNEAVARWNIVGVQPYQFIDQELHGNSFDGENRNFGFLDVTDTPYPQMVAASRAFGYQMYALRNAAPGQTP